TSLSVAPHSQPFLFEQIVAHNFPGRSEGYAHPELRRRGEEGEIHRVDAFFLVSNFLRTMVIRPPFFIFTK
ncbi:MAG TPA: hypothetical protein VJR02_05090, partial [Pyrinomonadaceae bacterium]|nr:hypothetical protein [Pyrinomonadaceae bacterium]